MPRTATIKKLRPLPEFPLDSHPEVSLDFTRVKQYLARHPYKKPVLLVDLDIVRTKARRFRAALPRVRPHFAVKANPDPRVLKVLIQEGSGFEIASIAELDILMGLGVPPAEVFYSNPMKSRAYLEYAAAKGVEWFVLDSVEELCKIQSAKRLFKKMRLAGLKPRLLDIGGGYPVRHVKPIPSIEKIAEVVNHAIRDIPQNVRIMAEPGRFLVSDAGYFVCRVVGTATRSGKRWMYWDAGVFGGVIETTEGLRYDIITDRTGPAIPWVVAGPTCDSVDVCMREEMFPDDMQEGDFMYIANAGAYTTAYASNFNGFPLPEVRVI